jgi:hypothetical protein
MRFLTTVVAAVMAFFAAAQGGGPAQLLPPEQLTTIHVGDLAEVRVDTDRHYSLSSADDALTLIRQAEEQRTTVYVFRAASPGRQTLVLTPRDPGPDGCISCVTVHYFAAVVR